MNVMTTGDKVPGEIRRSPNRILRFFINFLLPLAALDIRQLYHNGARVLPPLLRQRRCAAAVRLVMGRVGSNAAAAGAGGSSSGGAGQARRGCG